MPGRRDASPEYSGNNMKQGGEKYSLQMYLVELKFSCTSLRLCVKYYPNYILPQQLRALFGNQAYFPNVVGALS